MAKTLPGVFITDCEGPVTKNDNAAELAEAFIPRGDVFFSKLSLYDDYLAEVVHKPGYKAGDTLRLLVPFLKAFGLDNSSMMKFSRRNIQIIPDADETLRQIMAMAPSYIVSTSYSPYIMAVCDAIGFPFLNTFSTAVNLDKHALSGGEKEILRSFHRRILALPAFSIPASTRQEDLDEDAQRAIREMDDIFWQELPKLDIYRLVQEVNPVGGYEKATAVDRIVASLGLSLDTVLYVGDSITDVQAFRKVRDGKGFAVSFNGNDWAVNGAAYAVTARTALPLRWLAEVFFTRGRDALEDLLMTRISQENRTQVAELSCRVRKSVRTEKIGALG
jgi:energy-converting hydrogenase A subunit R|uniref:Uncharacterized protein n=1 Tax=Desulfomonile tiedjei TaxID=2358 RepID=A0A7C4ES94_9BACT